MERRHPPTFSRILSVVLSIGVCLYCSESALGSWLPWQKKSTPRKSPPLGAEAKIRFQGTRTFSEKKLLAAIEEQIKQIRNEGLTRPNADDAAYYISAFYQDNGFADVEVGWEILDKELLISVTEGESFQLRNLRVSGNVALPTKDIISVLQSPTSERFEEQGGHLPFVLDDLRRGSSRVVDWYQGEGFLNAEVAAPEVVQAPGSREVDVTINITEGKRYHFGAVTIEGQAGYETPRILAEIAALTNQPYTAARVLTIQSTLQQFYTDHAHFLAEVEAIADPNTATPDFKVPLLLRIKAGPTYVFKGMDVEGLSAVKPSWMKARLISLEGQPYNAQALAAKSSRLMSSGIFSSLQITPIPQPDNTLKLQVRAEEAKARELGFSGGYGSYEGLMLGIRTSNRNLFGQGLQGGVELGVSQRTISAEATFADPWLFETQTEFISRVFLRSRLELGYDKREGGVRGELSRKLFRDLQVAAYAQSRTVEITSSQINQSYLGKTAYQIGTTGISTTLDRRDDPLHPTRGWIAAGLVDSNVLENGNSFLRTTGRFGWHYPLPWGIGFATSGRIGVLFNQSQPPIDERFFLGGATTVRSFRERELGSHDTQSFPIGGSAYSLANVETDFPLWQMLRGALFYDIGSLSDGGERVPLSNFRSALGVGLRYALPVGPLRFDVGFNPNRKPNESWGAVHLSFGFAF